MYCIPLGNLKEKSYNRCRVTIAFVIILIYLASFIVETIHWARRASGGPIDPLIDNLAFSLIIVTGLPYLLTFFFHGKSLVSIYLITKCLPGIKANLKMMALHFISITLLFVSTCLFLICSSLRSYYWNMHSLTKTNYYWSEMVQIFAITVQIVLTLYFFINYGDKANIATNKITRKTNSSVIKSVSTEINMLEDNLD